MSEDRDDLERRGAERLATHAAACEECRAQPLPLAEIARGLAAYTVPLDVAALSRRVTAALHSELARRASAWFWRRLARVTVAALLPLPVVLLLDVFALRFIYEQASAVLPAAVAAYLVVSYAAAQLLLFAATYAAIPLVLARDAWQRAVTPVEAIS